MTKPWPLLHATELSLLLAMVFYVNSLIIIFHPFLSYFFTMLLAFATVYSSFFIISNCLEMGKSFGSLFLSHILFVAAQLTNLCEVNSDDFGRGYMVFLIGVLFLSLHTLYNWYRNWFGLKKVGDHQQRSDDPSEEINVVPRLVEMSVSCLSSGIAMMGRWFIPRDSLLWLVVGAGIMFSTGVLFFCYYRFSSGKSRRPNQLFPESENSVSCSN